MNTAVPTKTNNLQITKSLYEAFGRGDVDFILSHLADDIEWRSYFESYVPWGGDFSGKANVPGFFKAIYESVEVLGFEPQEFVVDGDMVASYGTFEARSLATGKSAKTRWAFLWRFRGDKVAGYEQFHDPSLSAIFLD